MNVRQSVSYTERIECGSNVATQNRQLDGHDSLLRRELIDNVTHEARRTDEYVDGHLRELHKGGLITITRGTEYASRITIAG